MPRLTSRRSFLGSAAAFAAAPLLPRWSGPRAPLRVAAIGVGGMGRADLEAVAAHGDVRIAALCDVDAERLGGAVAALAQKFGERHAGARTFADYRRLFDAMENEIDAVIVSTPDHMHGPIAIGALVRKKHVYCQKPLAHSLRECRRMTELAREHRLVTQLGTQIHAHEAYRTAVATLQNGAIGKVREVHCWVGKSWAGPAEGRPEREDPVPASLDWDLWLGASARRPYVKDLYHPANWRGWTDFGTGTLGDMGCHILDPVATALGLGAPTSVVSRGPEHDREVFAKDGDVEWTFAATRWTDGDLRLRWTDGAAPRAADRAQLPPGVDLPGGGSFAVGERGVMVLPHWAMPRFYRDGEPLAVELVTQAATNHWHEWVDACRGDGATTTPFSYSGPLTETVLTGVVAGFVRGERLRFDSARLRFSDARANARVARSYRPGFAPEA